MHHYGGEASSRRELRCAPCGDTMKRSSSKRGGRSFLNSKIESQPIPHIQSPSLQCTQKCFTFKPIYLNPLNRFEARRDSKIKTAMNAIVASSVHQFGALSHVCCHHRHAAATRSNNSFLVFTCDVFLDEHLRLFPRCCTKPKLSTPIFHYCVVVH